MRIGIYNRWLFTLGGGEQYCLSIAESLARRHSVSVITHKPVSKTSAAKRLNLDLSRVKFVSISDRPTIETSSITTQYDFFINASFLDVFPSYAPHSALVIFFPTPLNVEYKKSLYRRVGLMLKRWLMVPTFTGTLETKIAPGSQLRNIGSLLRIKLPASPRGYPVRFELASRDITVRHAAILLDGHELATMDLPADQSFVYYRTVLPATTRAFHEITIQSGGGKQSSGDAPIKFAMTHFEIEQPRYRFYELLFEHWLTDWGLRLHRTPSQASTMLDCVDTYESIWAISEFSSKWIKNYWSRPSSILYPAVGIENFKAGPKQKRILTVGRFFTGSHNKKHNVMVAAFKEMVSQGLRGWELHLAGGTSPGESQDHYLQRLMERSEGYPIVFHPDISFDDLISLYGESSIYWHAGGLGEDENREPIRFEHFGITTVEAMASGCVPVVIGKGGQPEIVRHGENGFLWQTVDELKGFTQQLIQDDSLRHGLANAAIRDSQRYDKVHFNSRLQELLRQIGID